MGKKMKKQLLSALLSSCMVLGLIPGALTTAFAAEPEYITMAYPSFSYDTNQDSLITSGRVANDYRGILTYAGEQNQVGGLFAKNIMPMGTDGFSLAAKTEFGISNGTAVPGTGIAFVFAKDATECTEEYGDGLGYKGLTGESIAVEYFATNSRHGLALGQDGVQYADTLDSDGLSASPYDKYVYFWIDYNASNTELAVYLSFTSTRPTEPTKTYSVDLSGYKNFHLGVTGATGTYHQMHKLNSWYYDAAYHSDSLSLDGTTTYDDDFSVKNVTSTGATVSDIKSTEGFEYRESGAVGTETQVEATDGSATITGLAPGTSYEYRSYWTTSDDTIYGNWKSFTTLEEYQITVPEGCYIGEDTTMTSQTVMEGDSVTVTAPEVAGKNFTSWTDGDGNYISDEATYTFTASKNLSLTANYATMTVLSGAGTRTNPYKISNVDDLNTLAAMVNNGDTEYVGAYYSLTQDITLSDTPFIPIGFKGVNEGGESEPVDYPFEGIFDGNEHTISNLHVEGVNYGGLFGYAEGATFTNLTVVDASVSADENAGGVVGYASDTVILGCNAVNCSVTGGDSDENCSAGGIVGTFSSVASLCNATNCTVTGVCSGGIIGRSYSADISLCEVQDSTVTSSLNKYSSCAGGIIGKCDTYNPQGKISDCTVSGGSKTTISGKFYTGGIVGYCTEDIEKCTAICDVSSKEYTGGIAGYLHCKKVSQCEYNGNITGIAGSSFYGGGIVGLIYTSDGNLIQNCVAYGTVNSGDPSHYVASGILGQCGGVGSYSFTIDHNVAMQSDISAGKVNSLCAANQSSTSPLTDSYCNENYAGDFLTLMGTLQGVACDTKAAAEMDESFWSNLGFTPANGWVYETENKTTTAGVEVHRGEVTPFTLTVSGNAVPCYSNTPLTKNGDNTYTVYAGMKISMRAADEYKITQMDVNGTTLSEKPWEFTVSDNTDVSVSTAEATNAIWAYKDKYVVGAYDANSTVDDIDWAGAKTSSITPLSGTYTDMDLYLFGSSSFGGDNVLKIGQLNLGNGKVIVPEQENNPNIFISGKDENSFLHADAISAAEEFEILDLTVNVNTLFSVDGIVIFSDGIDTSLTVKNDAQLSDLFMGAQVTFLGNLTASDDVGVFSGNLKVSGNLTAGEFEMGSSYGDGSCDGTAEINGDLKTTSTSNGVFVRNYSDLQVSGKVEAYSFSMADHATAKILGGAVVSNSVSLVGSSVLDVTGTLSAASGIDIKSKNAVLINAASDSSIPIFNSDTGDTYFRTMLTGMPKNTLMNIVSALNASQDMSFIQRTDGNGQLVVWLRKSGDTVTATTLDGTEYSGSDTVGNSKITLGLPTGVFGIALSADVPSQFSAGETVNYCNTNAVSGDGGYTCDNSHIEVSLVDDSGNSVAVDTPLSVGKYDLVLTYIEKDGNGNLVAYGTVSYPITVVNQYTISFDAAGGSAIESIKGASGTHITLPTPTRTGYTFGGWSDGSKILAGGTGYIVTKNVTLTAVWQERGKSHGGGGEGGGMIINPFPKLIDKGFYSLSVEKDQTLAEIDSAKILKEAVQGGTLDVDAGTTPTGKCIIDGETFKKLGEKHVLLQIQSDGIGYGFPTDAIGMDSVLDVLGADEEDLDQIKINITIQELTGDSAKFIKNAIANASHTLMVPPVEFSFKAEYNGKSVEISKFQHEIERKIPIPKSVDPGQISTAVVVSSDGSQRHVPTSIVQIDGTYYAKINSITNSVYALIGNSVNFSDTMGKWYKDIASEMASRLIISGRDGYNFDGDSNITRAEFVSILVRALGLPKDGKANFGDISENDWYYGAVGTAVEYGLVKGCEDGSFHPNDNLTRQEAMLMLQHAAVVAEYTGVESALDLSSFADDSQIGSWAQDAVVFNVSNGLVVGSDNQLRPTDTITRAECAAVVLRLLQKAGLIDIRTH
ncbi:S-layer homology domain-containing protein [Anaerotignum sp.]|uniref:S-layer homology domain-containing protein n=1 Tax=Anaerotignum sp. TaxID=2039241 RepID=UPI0027155360|nr:S-layer homology domain-containing protein [Anaerotignum sp.]